MTAPHKNFNKEQFEEILKLKSDKKHLESMQEYRVYLKKYPNDICVLISFALFLINSGYIEEASEIIENIAVTNKNSEGDLKRFLFAKIKILGSQKKYKECYELFMQNSKFLRKNLGDYRTVEIFLKKKLGIPLTEYDSAYSYTTYQIVKYSEQLAIEHIKDNHGYTNTQVKTEFAPSFNIEKCYHKIREMLPVDGYPKMLFSGAFRNVYIFKYIGCGMIFGSEEKLDYIKVVTLQDSNEIITMYPFDNEENYPFIDITSKVNEDDNQPFVRRMSQIDKFNKKYGLQ